MMLTVSIVTANNKDLVLRCLETIYRTTEDLDKEIYVVLNASQDDSETAIRERFPDVRLLVNQTKLGFTHNHNSVLRRAKGKYVLILNDDVVILDNALQAMAKFMEANTDVGITGCKILNDDGTLQWSAGSSFSHKLEYFKQGALRSAFPLVPKQYFEKTRPVSWVTGACMLVRGSAVQDVGGFDSNILIYYEDGDWCYRMLRAGWRVMFCSDAEVIHFHGQTRKKHLSRDTYVIYQSRLYFFSKHYGRLTYGLVKVLTFWEISWRSAMATLANLVRREPAWTRLFWGHLHSYSLLRQHRYDWGLSSRSADGSSSPSSSHHEIYAWPGDESRIVE